MLTPSYLLEAPEPAEDIAEQLHQDILKRIIDRIVIRLGRGEEYLLTPVDKWQIEVLQDAGFLLEDIEKEIAKATGKMQDEIAQAMEDAGVRSIEYDDELYKAAGLNPKPLTQSPHMVRLMQDAYEQTVGEWKNFTKISKKAAHALFVEACDTAYMQAMSGAISPTQAYLEALEKIIDAGLVVQYKNKAGKVIRQDTIETATARAIRTGISQASGRIQLERMKEMGYNLVLVSSHLGARPSHYEWQGKIYSIDGTGDYPELRAATGYGTVTGLCGANCRHSMSPYIEGMENPWKEYDRKDNQKQYQIEQRQRTMENRIRKTKTRFVEWEEAAKKETDPTAKAKLQEKVDSTGALLKSQISAYYQYCEETGQKRRSERITVAVWNRNEAAKAREAAKRKAQE